MNYELWAILHGLELVWLGEHKKVIVETDCLQVVKMIKDCSNNTPSMTLVRKIKKVYCQFNAVKFQFVHRRGNTIVDWLAKIYPNIKVSLRIIDVLIFHIRKLLLEDKLGNPWKNKLV